MFKKTKTLLMATTLMGFGAAASALETDATVLNADILDKEQTIVANAAKVQNLSTLVTAVQAAGLVDALNGEGPFTVFAPMNEAFEAVPSEDLANLLKPENRDALVDLLEKHVVAGSFDSFTIEQQIQDLGDEDEQVASNVSESMIGDDMVGAFETLDGTELFISVNGGDIYINQPGQDPIEVIVADVETSNGVVHLIDGVIMN